MPEYRPPWAKHVVGTFPNREFEDVTVIDPTTKQERVIGKRLVPMKIVMRCEWPECNGAWQHTCETGAVHQWIQKFAVQHVHRDPMKVGPGGT